MLRRMKDFEGLTIGASDGDIGTVEECYFDDASYTVRYVVVGTGGWLLHRKVLLSPIAVRAIDWEHGRIIAALTRAQVEGGPDIDVAKPVSRQHETAHARHYDHAPYWVGSLLWGLTPYPYIPALPVLRAAELERERRWDWEAKNLNDVHLRSSRVVTGYHVHAADGDIGHVDDYLVDDRSWTIRYMVVSTTNWWPGKKVLVEPAWITRVDWAHSLVHLSVTRAKIKDSPDYDSSRSLE